MQEAAKAETKSHGEQAASSTDAAVGAGGNDKKELHPDPE
jgi:hypothetical protein